MHLDNNRNINLILTELEDISSEMADNISSGNYDLISKMDYRRRNLIELISNSENKNRINNRDERIKLVYDKNKEMIESLLKKMEDVSKKFGSKKKGIKAYYNQN